MDKKKLQEYQEILKDTSRLIASADDLGRLFEAIYTMIEKSIGVKGVAVLIIDDKSGQFVVERTEGDNKSVLKQNIAASNPLIGHLVRTKEVLTINGKIPAMVKSELLKFDAVIAVPSFIKDQLICIYCVGPKQNGKPYSKEDLEILASVAAEGAVAIENSRLYSEVAQTKDYLRDLIDGSVDAIITLDLNSNALSWNRGAQEIFGYGEKEILNKSLSIFVGADIRDLVNTVIGGGKIKSLDVNCKNRKGEEVQCLLTMSPIKSKSGEVIAVSLILKDITEIRKIDKMKNEFLAMLSHELRTPLNHICGFSQLLFEEIHGPLNKEQKDAASNIHAAGRRLTDLISSLLWFSSVEAGKKIELKREATTFDRLIGDAAVAVSQRFKEKNIALDLNGVEKEILASIDIYHMERVLIILFDNALKFTPAGGQVKVFAKMAGGSAKIVIQDNGIGIAKANLENIFDKFYQVDSSAIRTAEGIGMGLAMARAIIEAHGGKIWAESQGLGHGSKMCFELPIRG